MKLKRVQYRSKLLLVNSNVKTADNFFAWLSLQGYVMLVYLSFFISIFE